MVHLHPSLVAPHDQEDPSHLAPPAIQQKKTEERSAQGQIQTSITPVSDLGFLQCVTELRENFFKASKSLVLLIWHAAYKNNSETSPLSDAQGSALLSSKLFATATAGTENHQHIHDTGAIIMRKRWGTPALDFSHKLLQTENFIFL